MSVVPHSFLFSISIPVQYRAAIPNPEKPTAHKGLLDLAADCRLPDFSDLDQKKPFAQISLAWNENGLGIVAELTGKSAPFECDPARPDTSDGLQVWVDTRNVQNVHRATRYCHRFGFQPTGKTSMSKSAKLSPAIGSQLPIDRSRDETQLADPKKIGVHSAIKKDGYILEAWLPAEILTGFDPVHSPQLSFYYHLHDGELGDQFLTVDKEFPFAHDPSLWSTIELVK